MATILCCQCHLDRSPPAFILVLHFVIMLRGQHMISCAFLVLVIWMFESAWIVVEANNNDHSLRFCTGMEWCSKER
jgi:hypothetical protein